MSPFDFRFDSGRFPQAAGEPPRATHCSGVSPRHLLLLESPLPSLQSNFSQLTRFDFFRQTRLVMIDNIYLRPCHFFRISIDLINNANDYSCIVHIIFEQFNNTAN